MKKNDALSIEDAKSLELYRARSSDHHRQLKKHQHHDHHEDHHQYDHHQDHHRHRHHQDEEKRPPPVKENTQHGMMIDAGSQGSRIHVYEFEARILRSQNDVRQAVAGRKLSFPTTDTRWTDRLKPGLDSFAFIEDQDEMVRQVTTYLAPLFDFAKMVLAEKEKHWGDYPCYLKATGGLRSLPRPYRIRLIGAVRTVMHTATFNPFYFEDE